MSDLRKLNRDLKNHFGKAKDDPQGRPAYRLAFTQQIEKRIGNVIKETESGVYLGVQSGVHEMPKYNYHNLYEKPKWVLEQFLFAPLPEVPDTAHGNYEPVYMFPYIDGRCVMPTYKAVELFIYCCRYGPKKTLSDYTEEDKLKMKKEVEMFKAILDDQQSYMQSQMQAGEAITVAKNFGVDSPLLREIHRTVAIQTALKEGTK